MTGSSISSVAAMPVGSAASAVSPPATAGGGEGFDAALQRIGASSGGAHHGRQDHHASGPSATATTPTATTSTATTSTSRASTAATAAGAAAVQVAAQSTATGSGPAGGGSHVGGAAGATGPDRTGATNAENGTAHAAAGGAIHRSPGHHGGSLMSGRTVHGPTSGAPAVLAGPRAPDLGPSGATLPRQATSSAATSGAARAMTYPGARSAGPSVARGGDAHARTSHEQANGSSPAQGTHTQAANGQARDASARGALADAAASVARAGTVGATGMPQPTGRAARTIDGVARAGTRAASPASTQGRAGTRSAAEQPSRGHARTLPSERQVQAQASEAQGQSPPQPSQGQPTQVPAQSLPGQSTSAGANAAPVGAPGTITSPSPSPATSAAASPGGPQEQLPGVTSQLVRVLSPPRPVATGTYTLRVSLHPEALGTVQATVTASDARLAVHLVASTSDGELAIRQSLADLHEALSSDGQQTSVTVSGGGSPGTGSAGGGHGQRPAGAFTSAGMYAGTSGSGHHDTTVPEQPARPVDPVESLGPRDVGAGRPEGGRLVDVHV